MFVYAAENRPRRWFTGDVHTKMHKTAQAMAVL